LKVTQLIFNTPSPPENFSERLRSGCPSRLRSWIDRYALTDVTQLDYRRPDKADAYVLTYLAAQSMGEKFGIMRYALLPPRQFIILKYQLKQPWLAIPCYVPYILGRTFDMLKPFIRAVTRSSRPAGDA
jgi:hypothetical protein